MLTEMHVCQNNFIIFFSNQGILTKLIQTLWDVFFTEQSYASFLDWCHDFIAPLFCLVQHCNSAILQPALVSLFYQHKIKPNRKYFLINTLRFSEILIGYVCLIKLLNQFKPLNVLKPENGLWSRLAVVSFDTSRE